MEDREPVTGRVHNAGFLRNLPRLLFYLYSISPHTLVDTLMLSMLQRIAATRVASRQLSRARAAQNLSASPFTALTRIGSATHLACSTATGRGEADSIYRPRAMMSSSSARHLPVSGTATYVDHRLKPDVDFDDITSNMSCTKFHDSVWGFVVRLTPRSLLS